MLNKIFGRKKSNDTSIISTQAKPVGTRSGLIERQSRALKIIHAGGHAENYYMAIPAARIIEKHHPSFVLARPEIFRRPWESVIRPDEILVPGQKYYLVPRRTVMKLRRRTRKTTATNPSFSESHSQLKDSLSSISGILVKPGLKIKTRNLHVRFFGINDTTNHQKPGGSVSVPSEQKHGNKEHKSSKKERLTKPDHQMDDNKRKARIEIGWEPSLHSITE